MYYSQSLISGALFIICAEFMAVITGALIKMAHDSLPMEAIVFFRNLFILLAVAPLIVRFKINHLKIAVIQWHIARAIFGLGGIYSYIYVLSELKLVNAMLLLTMSPIFIPIAAFLILGETINRWISLAILIGFLGIIAILQPDGSTSTYTLIGVAGSFSIALGQVIIRKLSKTEPAQKIVFYFAFFASIVTAIPLTWSWQSPTLWQWGLLVALGGSAAITQLLVTRGFASAPASQVGIFTYSSVFLAAVTGWLFWGEVWDIISVTGAILIIAAGLVVLRYTSAERLKKSNTHDSAYAKD
ncbi:DMT family transporter [Dasania marina]|uniref:DMT family transporter n=1 Tax=Dasania marina TaxID=471499 RepID=UPI0003680DAA|nr:DMT family transporter [Dasania marina]